MPGTGDPRGWEAIRAAFRARIEARDWPPGALIPGEVQLASELGVSRATVNRALQDLADEGLVERRRRAGTRVASGAPRRVVLSVPLIRAEVEAQGRTHGFRILAQAEGTTPAEVARRMGARAPRRVLHVETLHLADGAPFAHELRWLNPAAIPAPLPDLAAVTLNEWLVATVPYATGEIAFSAEAADAAAARTLDCPPGAALFRVERATRTDRGPITFVRLLYAPGYRLRTGV